MGVQRDQAEEEMEALSKVLHKIHIVQIRIASVQLAVQDHQRNGDKDWALHVLSKDQANNIAKLERHKYRAAQVQMRITKLVQSLGAGLGELGLEPN